MRRLFILVSLCALVSTGCASLLEPAAAVVNDDKITVHQIDVELDRYENSEDFKRLSEQNDPGVIRRRFEQGYLAQLIRRQVLRSEAAERDIEVTDSEVDARLEQIQDEAGGERELEERTGLQIEEIRELVRDALYQDALRADVVAGTTPLEEDLRAEYQRRLDEFRQTRASHILFKNKDKVVAQGVADQLQVTPKNELPQVFRDLVAQYSTDKASRAKGGDLGYFVPGQFVQEFEQAAAELPEGAVSEPVRSDFGFHIIYVTDRRTRSFEDVRPELAEEIATTAEDQVWQEWLFEAFSRADIRVNPRYGEFDLETQQISDAGAGDVPGTEPVEEAPSPQG